jgi:hypothetical protein
VTIQVFEYKCSKCGKKSKYEDGDHKEDCRWIGPEIDCCCICNRDFCKSHLIIKDEYDDDGCGGRTVTLCQTCAKFRKQDEDWDLTLLWEDRARAAAEGRKKTNIIDKILARLKKLESQK